MWLRWCALDRAPTASAISPKRHAPPEARPEAPLSPRAESWPLAVVRPSFCALHLRAAGAHHFVPSGHATRQRHAVLGPQGARPAAKRDQLHRQTAPQGSKSWLLPLLAIVADGARGPGIAAPADAARQAG